MHLVWPYQLIAHLALYFAESCVHCGMDKQVMEEIMESEIVKFQHQVNRKKLK